MRYITIPKPIPIPHAQQALSFRQIMQEVWLNDQRFGETIVTLRTCARLTKQFEESTPGSEIGIEEADYALLKQVVESPRTVTNAGIQQGYKPDVMKYAIGHCEAVLNAVEKSSSAS